MITGANGIDLRDLLRYGATCVCILYTYRVILRTSQTSKIQATGS